MAVFYIPYTDTPAKLLANLAANRQAMSKLTRTIEKDTDHE